MEGGGLDLDSAPALASALPFRGLVGLVAHLATATAAPARYELAKDQAGHHAAARQSGLTGVASRAAANVSPFAIFSPTTRARLLASTAARCAISIVG